MRRTTLVLAALVLTGGVPCAAHGGPIAVFVGYADDLRPSPFFPSLWQGSPDTIFVGNGNGYYDAGAIRIDNTSGATLTVDVTVTLPPGIVYDLWGAQNVPARTSLILTQLGAETFDTSDHGTLGGPPGYPDGETDHAARVDVFLDGSTDPLTFLDTGHVLTTGGFDYAQLGNESLQWRPISTTGIDDPAGNPTPVFPPPDDTPGTSVPEPTSLTLIVVGLVGLAVCRRRVARLTSPPSAGSPGSNS
jgi:hypothetical protein